MKKSEYKYDDIEEWLDDLIVLGLDILTKQKRQQYFMQGRLFIANTFEYHFSYLDINDKIDVLYEAGKELYKSSTNKYRKCLNTQEIQSIILESIWQVLQDYELKSYEEYSWLIVSYIKNKCCNLLDYKQAKKRGGETTHTSLDKDEPIIIPIKDNSYNNTEMNIWANELTNLTDNERKYLLLIIEEPHILEMTDKQIAEELGITVQGLAKMQKRLKTKLNTEDMKH